MPWPGRDVTLSGFVCNALGGVDDTLIRGTAEGGGFGSRENLVAGPVCPCLGAYSGVGRGVSRECGEASTWAGGEEYADEYEAGDEDEG